MDVEIKEKENQRHVGRNLQRIRVYLGMKQEALAADLGVNQQIISKIEKQEEIEEGFLKELLKCWGYPKKSLKTLMLKRRFSILIIIIIRMQISLKVLLHTLSFNK